jgi:cyclophilin family peptidyl-prolyl cis-trans isomerase/HEAT repeat protein
MTSRSVTTVVDHGLQATNPIVRAYAARTIGQVRIGSRARQLRDLLAAGGDSSVMADAAFSLGLLRDRDAVRALLTALGGGPTVVDAAAWALGEIGEPARSAMETVLRAGTPDASLAAVLQATAKLRPPPVAAIAPYLRHPDPLVRRGAAYALTRPRVPAAVRPLLELENTFALSGGAAPASGAAPSAAAADAVADTRSYVARGLARPVAGDSLAEAAIAALDRLVEDRHPHVRINAIRSLATFGADARSMLLRHLSDPDGNVRIALAQSLGDVLDAASNDWSAAWSADTGFTYRRTLLVTAVRSGARLGALDSRETAAWQRSADWRYRAAAAEAAGAGNMADVDAIAVPSLRDPDGRVRRAAFAAALPWADSARAATKPYARGALPAALADSDVFVRATILGALRARARAPDASIALRAWERAARDPENDARVAALRVIAAAWAGDSASFAAALRDSLSNIAAPSDPIELAAARGIGPLDHWPRGGALPRARSWYADRVREFAVPELSGHAPRATIATERGTIELVLFGADAPLTVANFASLARRGYYDGLSFHRVVPNFVAQDGDPRGDGSGGPGYAIRDELNRRWYDRGAVGMALSGPDTGGSQYFLTHSPQAHLDGHYTVFGHVTSGLDVLDALVQGDRIVGITIR